MNAHELFRDGKLQEAVASAVEDVRRHPTDADRRLFLSELFCFTGDLERADGHLDAVRQADAQALPWVIAGRQLIRAEQARRDVFGAGRLPEFLRPPEGAVRLLLEATVRAREGALREAVALIEQVDQERAKVSGELDGRPFQDLRDLDDLTCCVFEVYTSQGAYYWIPIEDVESIEFHEPTLARDLRWRRVNLSVRGGPDGEVFLPALYADTYAEPDDPTRLGRATDWRGGEGSPVRGVGQRTYLIGEEALPIMELKSLRIDSAGPP